MKLLLDTCTFLWVATEPAMLSERASELVRDPQNDVLLSSASSWEIAIKAGLGKLPLPEPSSTLVPRLRAQHSIASLPLDEDSALHVATLPDHHRDPFDRILVSQAIVHGMTLLTPDPLVRQYPARSVW